MTSIYSFAKAPRFEEGAVVRTRRRTLTDGDFALLISASWEDGPLHTDEVYARGTTFGRRILGGPCLVAVTAGLSSELLHVMWEFSGLEIVAALGIDEVRYVAPVFPGDTVCIEMTIASLRPSPGGSRLVGTISDRMLNQDDQVVLTMARSYLLKPIGPEDPA